MSDHEGEGRTSTLELAMEVAVILLSGEVIAELTVASMTTVAQVKDVLAKCDETGTPARRYKLLFENKELYDGMALKEIRSREFQKIILQLIRLSCYTFTREIGSIYKHDFTFKLILVGSSGSGKTSILSRFVHDKFSNLLHSSATGDLETVSFRVDERTPVKCNIWDTPGQEYLRDVSRICYQNCHGAVIVFDITDRASYDSVHEWQRDITRHSSKNIPMCIVGNKTDLGEQRQVTEAEAIDFATAHGTRYYEVSAKGSINVASPFYHLIEANIDRH